nr:reverse transcriptase domain-containing protein [Tanacetum cinerariifolium]
MTSQSGKLQKRGPTFEVSQRKEKGLAGLPPLTRTPKEILTDEAGKFQPPPLMVTLVEKRSSNKFCDFHKDNGHNTNECMQFKKQIEELVRAGKLSHLIKEIKHGRDQEITFPSLATSSGTEGPLVIEAKISRHMVHRMYGTEAPQRKYSMSTASTGSGLKSRTKWSRSLSPYIEIIGRPGIKEIQAVPSTAHEMLKFPADGGIVIIRSTILIPVECATVITSSKEIPKEAGVRHEKFKVVLHPNFPDQKVAIEGTLSAKGRTELCSLLKENLDIFAWQPSDMTGVPRSVAEHRLNIREGYSSVRQKKRGQAPERAKSIQAELANVRRFHGFKQGMSAGLLPLPKIDWKVESLYGYPFKCFFDAYKGYHQIQLAESDEEKMAFHTGQGVYCYTNMPFDLKNTGATYQRLVDKAFDSQIGQNIEVYVDDLVIKSHTEAKMPRDIGETFRTLRKINMKLNPKKGTFGTVEGMFLGHMTLEGIKPCPDKTEAVLQLASPRTIKKVQSLNGKLASLNRFLSKSAETSLLLFKPLKKCSKKSDFHWTSKAEQAFKQLKQHLSELPLLVAPKPKEELIVYLSASYGAISAVLMTERGTVQTPIYFISYALQGLELNYTPMEKLVLSLVFAAKRLRSVMLGEHNITYRPRMSVKGQTLFTDGSSCVDGSGVGLILTSPEGMQFTYVLRFQFAASNNEAKYEALIAGIRITAQMGVQNVHVSVDSKLVANQVLGAYVAKEKNMIKYLEKVKILVSGFTNFSINQVPRSKNKKADALSMIASISFAHLSKQVLVEILKEKSIQEKEVTTMVEEDGLTWMTSIIEYLKEGTLPSDRNEARKLCIKARQYELLEGVLYRRSFLTSWLRCVGPL